MPVSAVKVAASEVVRVIVAAYFVKNFLQFIITVSIHVLLPFTYQIQRRLGNKHIPFLNQRLHIAVEEC